MWSSHRARGPSHQALPAGAPTASGAHLVDTPETDGARGHVPVCSVGTDKEFASMVTPKWLHPKAAIVGGPIPVQRRALELAQPGASQSPLRAFTCTQ